MDRLFLDSNIFFSTAYGSPGIKKFWELAQKGKCQLLASRYVIEEAKRNLAAPEHLERLFSLLDEVELVPEAPAGLPCPIELPDKDYPIILAAIYSRATHLITGDVRHFGPFFGKSVQGVKIQTPADYLRDK